MDAPAIGNEREFVVVVNDEEQYAIYPCDRALPLGWRDAGRRGDRQACLTFIQEVWSDMRPKSLRECDARDATA